MRRLRIAALFLTFIMVFQIQSEAGPFGRWGWQRSAPCYGPAACANPCYFDTASLIGEQYIVGETVSLFNGVDLTGWTNFQGEAVTDGWIVQDDAIYKKEGQTGDLFTAKEYEHFILEFDFKLASQTNSGVKYKVWEKDGWGMGCEYQVFNKDGSDSGPLHETASLYDVYAPAQEATLRPVGEFNHGKIVVMGNYIEHWLNGVRTVSTVIDSYDWRARVAKSKFSEYPEFGHIGRSRLFFQDHGTPVWFKNVTITELTPVCGN